MSPASPAKCFSAVARSWWAAEKWMNPSRLSSGDPKNAPDSLASSHSLRRRILKIMTLIRLERRLRRKAEIGACEREVFATVAVDDGVQSLGPRLHRRLIGVTGLSLDRSRQRVLDL